MSLIHILTLIPIIGMLGFLPLVNQVTPLVLGLPLNLFWVVLWVILTSVTLAIIYKFDPTNREGDL